MGRYTKLSRRNFFKLCTAAASLISANPQVLAQPKANRRNYKRVSLVDTNGRPLTCSQLQEGENYLFHYPFISTPCFLINLGKVEIQPTELKTEDGTSYEWTGGVGPRRSVVAFSAICAHRMSHPAQPVSFIRYRKDPATFMQTDKEVTQRSRVIYCCSEKSVYDPTQGARVLGGPAPQPLAAILLEEDDNGNLYATGTSGGEMFNKYFDKFYSRLILEYKTTDLQQMITGTTRVMPLEEHSRYIMTC